MNAEAFRAAEMSMLGMMSTDYGNNRGEFVKPIILGGTPPQNYPEDRQILEQATSRILVSLDKNVQTPIEQVTPVAAKRDAEPPPIAKAEKPQTESMGLDLALGYSGYDGPDTTTTSVPVPSQPLSSLGIEPISWPPGLSQPPIDVSSPAAQLEGNDNIAPVKGMTDEDRKNYMQAFPPGIGREVTDPAERAQILKDAEELASGPTRQVPRQGQGPSGEGAPRTAPAKLQVEAAAVDFGKSTDRSYHDSTASQSSLLDAASTAVDSVDNTTELFVMLLTRLTSNQIRAQEALEKLLDKVDWEDQVSEF